MTRGHSLTQLIGCSHHLDTCGRYYIVSLNSPTFFSHTEMDYRNSIRLSSLYRTDKQGDAKAGPAVQCFSLLSMLTRMSTLVFPPMIYLTVPPRAPRHKQEPSRPVLRAPLLGTLNGSARGSSERLQDRDSEWDCVQPGELPSTRLPRVYIDVLDPPGPAP